MKQVSLPITNDTYVFTGLPNNNFYQKPHLKVGYLNTYEFMGYFYTLIKHNYYLFILVPNSWTFSHVSPFFIQHNN